MSTITIILREFAEKEAEENGFVEVGMLLERLAKAYDEEVESLRQIIVEIRDSLGGGTNRAGKTRQNGKQPNETSAVTPWIEQQMPTCEQEEPDELPEVFTVFYTPINKYHIWTKLVASSSTSVLATRAANSQTVSESTVEVPTGSLQIETSIELPFVKGARFFSFIERVKQPRVRHLTESHKLTSHK